MESDFVGVDYGATGKASNQSAGTYAGGAEGREEGANANVHAGQSRDGRRSSYGKRVLMGLARR